MAKRWRFPTKFEDEKPHDKELADKHGYVRIPAYREHCADCEHSGLGHLGLGFGEHRLICRKLRGIIEYWAVCKLFSPR